MNEFDNMQIQCLVSVRGKNLPKVILLLSSDEIRKFMNEDKVLIITDIDELLDQLHPVKAMATDILGINVVVAETPEEIIIKLGWGQ